MLPFRHKRDDCNDSELHPRNSSPKPSSQFNQDTLQITNSQSPQMSTTYNYSIPSIIAAYGIGLAPHGYYFVKMMANAKGQASNILSVYLCPYRCSIPRSDCQLHPSRLSRPRENLTNLKGNVPAQVWHKLARAHAAHLNALEGLPMFAAAMVCLHRTPSGLRECSVWEISGLFCVANAYMVDRLPVPWLNSPRTR